MKLIRLAHLDAEMLFTLDAIDREELTKLLAAKLRGDPQYTRRRTLRHMLQVIAPEHEALDEPAALCAEPLNSEAYRQQCRPTQAPSR